MSAVFAGSPVVASPAKQAAPKSVQLAYLLGRHPAFSTTFFVNEIENLRQLGFDIVTASINPCDRPASQLEELERREMANTFYIKQAGVWGLLRDTLAALFLNPAGFLKGLYFTARLGGSPVRFFYFIEALLVGAWMRRNGRSHLHVHFAGPVASVGMIVAHTFPVTMSLTVHGPDEFYDVEKFYLREKIETSSFICCISSFARSQLMFLSPSSMWEKLVVSRLGVDPEKFSPLGRDLNTEIPEIVCVGRLVGAKGQHVLLAAVRRLLDEGRHVRLRLVGDGIERKHLEATALRYGITEHVVFEGVVAASRVRQILDNATIFALPSFAEGIPVALMEAMAMEIPCVSTTIAGIPELIRHELDGLLVPPSDDIELAIALARLIDDPNLRRRLGASGRMRVQESYELRSSVQRLAEIFQCRL